MFEDWYDGLVFYNYGFIRIECLFDMFGLSMFVKMIDGDIFYIYLIYYCGIEFLMGVFNFFDFVLKGCNEVYGMMSWVCFYDEY